MSEATVEQEPGHIEPEDMTAILAVLDGIQVSAEATRPQSDPSVGAWTLCVHWLQKGPVSSDTEAALPGALARIRDHFVTQGRTPPQKLELRGPDHQILLTVDPEHPAR